MPNTDSKKKCCKAHDAGFAGPHCNNPVPTPTKEVEGWEEEFDKKFRYIQEATDIYFEEHFGSVPDGKDLEKIKSFIRKTLSESRKEVEVESYKEGYDEASRIWSMIAKDDLKKALNAVEAEFDFTTLMVGGFKKWKALKRKLLSNQ